jgi:Glycosyl transferase family 2
VQEKDHVTIKPRLLRVMPVPASIVIPTRDRPRYLEVALASIAPQAAAAGAELLVVDDAGPNATVRNLAERFGARYEPHAGPRGLNAARNTGVERSRGELVAFVDDDVEVAAGWLAALLGAAQRHPEIDVFTGPIRPRLEGHPPRSCGREGPPITALELGTEDSDAVPYAWGANMAIRRSALERVGPFDPTLKDAGDEQEWQDRLRAEHRPSTSSSGNGTPTDHRPTDSTDHRRTDRDAAAGRIRYVAAAALDHRRCPRDARLRALARAAYHRGRAARRFDAWRDARARTIRPYPPGAVHRPYSPGTVSSTPITERQAPLPSLRHELRTLLGCLGHVLRRRCPAGLTMVAHSYGRLRQGLHERRSPEDPQPCSPASSQPALCEEEDFLSGESGTVGGLDAVRRELQDRLLDARELLGGQRLRLGRAARREPPRRRVLVLGVVRPAYQATSTAIRAELAGSRHDVELRLGPPGERGKFENLNRLLGAGPLTAYDWLLVVDDDVVLPRGFLDRLLFLAERLQFDLVQPAHRARSHAAWRITRRHGGTLARQTPFVEIGPVTAFASSTFPVLLPFPDLRMGWGLDLHWAALARARGWRCGVLDAVAVAHVAAPAAEAYSRAVAVAEARAFLAEHPYLSGREAQLTLRTHRGL